MNYLRRQLDPIVPTVTISVAVVITVVLAGLAVTN